MIAVLVFKVFLLDIRPGAGYRIASFVAVGVLLLLVSILYQRGFGSALATDTIRILGSRPGPQKATVARRPRTRKIPATTTLPGRGWLTLAATAFYTAGFAWAPSPSATVTWRGTWTGGV
ncbi:MAG: hypothetical protein R3E12_11195 [Candidatus Eisenbacteria bacterium]